MCFHLAIRERVFLSSASAGELAELLDPGGREVLHQLQEVHGHHAAHPPREIRDRARRLGAVVEVDDPVEAGDHVLPRGEAPGRPPARRGGGRRPRGGLCCRGRRRASAGCVAASRGRWRCLAQVASSARRAARSPMPAGCKRAPRARRGRRSRRGRRRRAPPSRRGLLSVQRGGGGADPGDQLPRAWRRCSGQRPFSLLAEAAGSSSATRLSIAPAPRSPPVTGAEAAHLKITLRSSRRRRPSSSLSSCISAFSRRLAASRGVAASRSSGWSVSQCASMVRRSAQAVGQPCRPRSLA